MNLPKNEYRISIISSCNMKCIYCHNEGNSSFSLLTQSQIREIIEKSYDLNITSVRLTGGEPLIHPEITEICKMLSQEYGLKVGINTNCIEITKLLSMIEKGWIERVVVGLDYFDGKISKQSKIGISSKEILHRILEIKALNCDVSISTVYNGDYENIYNLVSWCIKNKIRIKVIEVVKNEICSSSDKDYLQMQNKILHDFNFDTVIDDFEEINGYIGDFKNISFFPSLCRLRRCDLCKKLHFRITSDGRIKQCLHYLDDDTSILGVEGRNNILKEINREVNYHR